MTSDLTHLISKAADLMREQSLAYGRIDAVSKQLSGALVSGSPEIIGSLVRAGESELLRMRSRLVQIISALTAFADARAAAHGNPPDSTAQPLDPQVRTLFETASNELMRAARDFQRTRRTASSLSISGSSYATAFIETCGVPPMTYRAPYSRRGEGPAWA
jgi:hypothetical protein